MAFTFDKALGISQPALLARSQRSEILAANLANADTPNYKARDIDFQAMLKGEIEVREGMSMSTTHRGHIEAKEPDDSHLLYRVPQQPAIDGNTVDAADEQVRFSQNSVMYMTSLRFLGDKFSGLKTALRGE
ncbi:MAG: flagellar basal body rod protein FlgB [Gammaproteobacteria bacterium]|nr:flagellar basal body rod protein FlgB [Gammaproteobacteria bacterium]